MSTVQEIEMAIRRVPPEELAALRTWFAEVDAASWDRQIETDVAAGRLDKLASEALDEFRDRRCTEL